MEEIDDASSRAMISRQSKDDNGENYTPPSSIPDVTVPFREQSVAAVDSIVPVEEEQEYLTGFKQFMAMFSLTFVGFLILLDVSIVSTVSWKSLYV
jgi:hypothetical protein